jgi:hypothetical protein
MKAYPKEEVLPNIAIGLIDTGSQIGSPYYPEQESQVVSDGPFRPNQARNVPGVIITSKK